MRRRERTKRKITEGDPTFALPLVNNREYEKKNSAKIKNDGREKKPSLQVMQKKCLQSRCGSRSVSSSDSLSVWPLLVGRL